MELTEKTTIATVNAIQGIDEAIRNIDFIQKMYVINLEEHVKELYRIRKCLSNELEK